MPQIAFLDFETRSLADLPTVGAYNYARHPSTDALVLTWAFDDGAVEAWSPEWCWPDSNDWEAPYELFDHIATGGYVVAWNANFDRQIWNRIMVPKYQWPSIPLPQWLCAMAQAAANNLPGKLEKACEALALPRKDDAGARLIAQLSSGTRADWNPANHGKLGRFRAYGVKDTAVMRNVWLATRPLTLVEWGEYHASEMVNDRGVAVDVEFAATATRYAAAESADLNAQLLELTGDVKLTVTNHVRKSKWLHRQLWPAPEVQQLTARPAKKQDANGDDVERHSADRATREAVLDLLYDPAYAALFEDAHRDTIVQFLEILEAGNGAAVHKFTAIANQCAADGRVHGQYSFNGAGQTGRFSARAIQLHNLIRKPVLEGNPNRAIDAQEHVLDGASPEFLTAEYGLSVSRLLARLIRPTLIAPDGRLLVWGDWDQIEARVLPWLALSDGGERKLDLFRAGAPIYRLTAAEILQKSVDAVTDFERQAYGKVPELALGFGGSVGAFAAMGRNYGVTLPEERIRDIVDGWRRANAWAKHFWDELWSAAMSAWADPGTWYAAGRLSYLFHDRLMGGTLICALPDGRWLVYPQLRRETYEDPKVPGLLRTRVTFLKGFGGGSARVPLWYGVLAENGTQAVAASLLRRAVVALRESCVLHTHDEIGIEVAEKNLISARSMLTERMLDLPTWAEGLPLSVTIESGPYYHHR